MKIYLLAPLLALIGCAADAEPAPGITDVAWCMCVERASGAAECIALTDVAQFDALDDVTAITASHPLADDGTCAP